MLQRAAQQLQTPLLRAATTSSVTSSLMRHAPAVAFKVMRPMMASSSAVSQRTFHSTTQLASRSHESHHHHHHHSASATGAAGDAGAKGESSATGQEHPFSSSQASDWKTQWMNRWIPRPEDMNRLHAMHQQSRGYHHGAYGHGHGGHHGGWGGWGSHPYHYHHHYHRGGRFFRRVLWTGFFLMSGVWIYRHFFSSEEERQARKAARLAMYRGYTANMNKAVGDMEKDVNSVANNIETAELSAGVGPSAELIPMNNFRDRAAERWVQARERWSSMKRDIADPQLQLQIAKHEFAVATKLQEDALKRMEALTKKIDDAAAASTASEATATVTPAAVEAPVAVSPPVAAAIEAPKPEVVAPASVPIVLLKEKKSTPKKETVKKSDE